MKAVKTRLTLAIESSGVEIASEEESATSDRSVALLRTQIKLLNEEALRQQTECNNAYTEAIVMIEGFDCGISGAQWNKQRLYVAEMNEEWKKERERFNKYRGYLAETEDRLARSSRQIYTDPRSEEQESQ